jgi:hypothetical protein
MAPALSLFDYEVLRTYVELLVYLLELTIFQVSTFLALVQEGERNTGLKALNIKTL